MALTVEDGTGLADADAYAELADIAAYLTARGLTAFNALASTAIKEQKVRQATDYFEQMYGTRLKGSRFSLEQALSYPREGVVIDGFALDTDALPRQLLAITAELSERAAAGQLLPDTTAEEGSVIERTEKVGPLEETVKYASATSLARPTFPVVERLVRPLLRAHGGSILR